MKAVILYALSGLCALVFACSLDSTPEPELVDRMHENLLILAENADLNRTAKDYLVFDARMASGGDEALWEALEDEDFGQLMERLRRLYVDEDRILAADLTDALHIHTLGACGLLEDAGYSLSEEAAVSLIQEQIASFEELISRGESDNFRAAAVALPDRIPFGRIYVATMLHTVAERLAGKDKSDLIVEYCRIHT